MDRISRTRLLTAGLGAAAAAVAAPLTPAFAAPTPKDDDLGFVGFAATAELVLLALYGRALGTNVLSPAERTHVLHLRRGRPQALRRARAAARRGRAGRQRLRHHLPEGHLRQRPRDPARGREARADARRHPGHGPCRHAGRRDPPAARAHPARATASTCPWCAGALRSGTAFAPALPLRSASRSRGSSSTRTSASPGFDDRRRASTTTSRR